MGLFGGLFGGKSKAARRVFIFQDFANHVGLAIGEGFTPTTDDMTKLGKAGYFRSMAVKTGHADGELADDSSLCIALSLEFFGRPPGNGFGHHLVDLQKL